PGSSRNTFASGSIERGRKPLTPSLSQSGGKSSRAPTRSAAARTRVGLVKTASTSLVAGRSSNARVIAGRPRRTRPRAGSPGGARLPARSGPVRSRTDPSRSYAVQIGLFDEDATPPECRRTLDHRPYPRRLVRAREPEPRQKRI